MTLEDEPLRYIFSSEIPFPEKCISIYRFQYEKNPVYRRFSDALGISPNNLNSADEIPLLPIKAFKEMNIVAAEESTEAELIFRSSGTSGMTRSEHYVLDKNFYETAILKNFSAYFSFDEYILACHMPFYDKNPNSSLIWMGECLIRNDPSGQSSFVNSHDQLKDFLNLNQSEKKILVFGASFGLLDFIETGKIEQKSEVEILETGGMKTYRREISRGELRKQLSEGFNIPGNHIHSEYGMSELLSQMYAIGEPWFQAPEWVSVSIRKESNPLERCIAGEEGKIGIIDLANIYSCPFILTDDRGVMDRNERFQVLGRWNTDNLRGCNFMVEDE